MCIKCFDIEYSSFLSNAEFEEFENELDKKLWSNQIKRIGISESKWVDGYLIYACETCNSKWCLSSPNQAWRGFFLREEHIAAKPPVKNLKVENPGCLIVSLIIIALIVVVWGNR